MSSLLDSPSRAITGGNPAATFSDAALIELGGSHDECVYSQILFLHSRGVRVHLLLSPALARRLAPGTPVERIVAIDLGRGWRGRLRAARAATRYLEEMRIPVAVVNTAHGSWVRDLCLSARSATEWFGVIHNAWKLVSASLTQRLISTRIRKYFVLSDTILRNLRSRGCSYDLSSFYPIHLPSGSGSFENLPGEFRSRAGDARSGPERETVTSDGTEKLEVSIPGEISYDRRDYKGLLDALRRDPLEAEVRFRLLGDARLKDGPAFRRQVEEYGLEPYFRFFEGFIDHRTYAGEIRASALVLPLLHSSIPLFDEYLHFRVSGAFNLAFGFGKPLLLESAFRGHEDFTETSLFYEEPRLVAALRSLAKDRNELDRCRRALSTRKRWRFETQAERYLRFLEGA